MKHHAEDLKKKMLHPLREAAGLGSPPSSYTTNANKPMNACIKQQVNYKLISYYTFVLYEAERSSACRRQGY